LKLSLAEKDRAPDKYAEQQQLTEQEQCGVFSGVTHLLHDEPQLSLAISNVDISAQPALY
jgi:hypothetical protein